MPETLVSSETALAHFIERLQSSGMEWDPYPHYYLDGILPDDYYGLLLKHLPESECYENLFETTDLKLDHFRHRDQRNLNDGWTGMLSEDMKQFWLSFNAWFLGNELADAVLESFAAPMQERFGPKGSWPEPSVEAQLIRHRAGYFLGPHSDLYTKLIVLLIYLAPDYSSTHLGTSLYRPKQAGFSCADSRHYPFEDFITVKTVPYKPNSLLAFMRSDISFHGLAPLSDSDLISGPRNLIQYVLHDKQVRLKQLELRRSAAIQQP